MGEVPAGQPDAPVHGGDESGLCKSSNAAAEDGTQVSASWHCRSMASEVGKLLLEHDVPWKCCTHAEVDHAQSTDLLALDLQGSSSDKFCMQEVHLKNSSVPPESKKSPAVMEPPLPSKKRGLVCIPHSAYSALYDRNMACMHGRVLLIKNAWGG